MQVNPWAIPGSIVLAPIVFCALIGGMLKIMLTALWPSFAWLWADLAAAPIEWMRWVVDLLAALPYTDVPLAARWNWMLMAVYLVPLIMFLRLPLPRLGRWTRSAPTAAALMIIPALPLLVGVAPSPQREEIRIAVLAVGAGSCSVIELPRGGELVLVDCGSSTLIDLTRKCLGPYLRHHGKGSVDRLYISHANYDHFSAAHEIIPAYDVREIFLSPQFLHHAADNPPAQDLLKQLEGLRRPATILSEGYRQTLPGGAEMQVLWPPAAMMLSPNDSSLVLRLTFGGRSVLFTGDIQATAQLELLKNPAALKSDILIAPHHGSMEAPTPDFVRAVDPQQIISSNDRTLSIKQKRFEEAMVQRPLLRTHTSGAVTVSINRDGEMKVTPYRAVEAR